jgi:vacuolar iron transporter family protein
LFRSRGSASATAAAESAGGATRHNEPHAGGMAARLNWLHAAVLGSNDGVVSTAGLVVGVAGATSSAAAILTAGLAGLLAGALAIALAVQMVKLWTGRSGPPLSHQ